MDDRRAAREETSVKAPTHVDHQSDLVLRWLRDRIAADEGSGWSLGDIGGTYVMVGKRGVWGYREEAEGRCGFSVQSFSTDDSDPFPNEGSMEPQGDRQLSSQGGIDVWPAAYDSADVVVWHNDGIWEPYFDELVGGLVQLGRQGAGASEASRGEAATARTRGSGRNGTWTPEDWDRFFDQFHEEKKRRATLQLRQYCLRHAINYGTARNAQSAYFRRWPEKRTRKAPRAK